MKTKHFILATSLLLTLSGCTITGEYFIGDGFNNTSLTIKKDSTFIYETFHDVGGTSEKHGTWTKKKNIIILNSYAQPRFKPNSVLETIIPNQEKKLIIVQNMDITAHNAIISLNNGQEIDTLMAIVDTAYWNDNFPLFVTGAYTSIDTINNIRILGSNAWTDWVLRDDTFHVSNPNSNVIVIYAQPYNLYYGMKFIVDAELKFKRNRIYFWHVTKSKYVKWSCLRKQ